MSRSKEVLPPSGSLAYADDAFAACADADAVLILTDWQEFATLDLDTLYKTLRYPIVIDGRNLYRPRLMQKHGFTYLSIGRPAVHPVRDLTTSPLA